MRRTSPLLIAELAGTLAGVGMLIVTLIWPEWIEMVFGLDPDGGNGSLEWALVLTPAAVAAGSGILARLEWLRLKATTPQVSLPNV